MAFDFNLQTFCLQYKFHPLIAFNCIKFLEREGLIEITDELNLPSMVYFPVNRDELYRFQVANEQFDNFLKLLLRSYSGLFSGYVGIDEELLALRANLAKDIVYQYLLRLQSMKILKYIPRRTNPMVIYTEERLDENTLQISKENYILRKERYIKRMDSIIQYVSDKQRCRSELLLNYFGEKNMLSCGLCDVCEKKNKKETDNNIFEDLKNRILAKLTGGPESFENLVDEISVNFQEDQTIRVIQWLIDNGLVSSKEGKLVIRGK